MEVRGGKKRKVEEEAQVLCKSVLERLGEKKKTSWGWCNHFTPAGEQKLYNLYDISCDSSDSELNPDSSDSENKSVEDGEQEGEVLDVEGDRFIDVEILNRNIELCCNYCHQPVLHLIEASRKGLASEFVCFVFFFPPLQQQEMWQSNIISLMPGDSSWQSMRVSSGKQAGKLCAMRCAWSSAHSAASWIYHLLCTSPPTIKYRKLRWMQHKQHREAAWKKSSTGRVCFGRGFWRWCL